MSKPAAKKDVEAVGAAIPAQMAAYDTGKALMMQSQQKFGGGELQPMGGNGSSASAMDANRKRQTEQETTLGELRRKYGIR